MAEDKLGLIGVPSYTKLKLRERTKHVDAEWEGLRDAGSTPATSTKVSKVSDCTNLSQHLVAQHTYL